MKKCVMFASVALMLAAVLMSCSESADTLTAEERQMRDTKREVQATRSPPGPQNASMIQDNTKPADSDSGAGD